jgi:hypothetical protein
LIAWTRSRIADAPARRNGRPIISFATRLLLAAYFVEAGLILIIAPWSSFWDRNVFAGVLPFLDPVMASPYARGAVSGIGLITLIAGLAELATAFSGRRELPTAPPGRTLPFDR